MSKGLTRTFEALLVMVVLTTIVLGATWLNGAPVSLGTLNAQAPAAPAVLSAQSLNAGSPAESTAAPSMNGAIAPAPVISGTSEAPTPEITSTPGAGLSQTLATPLPFNSAIAPDALDDSDAPLLQQSPGTVNFLLLGSDASGDRRYARTDSIIVASINPEIPSVSMLSIPRDVQVRIPGFGSDRINTAFERGYATEYPGGGPGLLALVLRKNFGIKIDHYVRIDFAGFIKAIDTLGGVEVLAECELHDTFPDPKNPKRGIDLDVMPGKVSLTGQQALWYSRSRWSTSDFDRARRQQKVLRAVFRKAKNSNLLQNALGLYGDFRDNIETDIGIGDIAGLVEIAGRLNDLTIKNRVITFPIVKTLQRKDGALVLDPQPGILSFVAEALSPPVGNRTSTPTGVEVYNGSSRPDIELLAVERLTWEGFLVVGSGKLDDRYPESQIIDYGTSPKGSPIARLSNIFSVAKKNVIGQADPSSPSAARIVLGEDYNSCPNTASIAGDVVIGPQQGSKQVATPTAAP